MSASPAPAAPAPPARSIDRACFLCGHAGGPPLGRETWPVAGLGPVRIGFRVCGRCGAVRQDPALAPEAMDFHYRALSNYTNPGRGGEPSPRKRAAVAAQTALLGRVHPAPGRMLQVGSSDGYTLACFAREGWKTLGLDPSPAACALAQRRGVAAQVGRFEDFEPASGERFDAVVMTHVLEHLYDPVAALRRAFALLAPGGALLIEVPALAHEERWPPGFFSLEHVNYFSPETLAAAVTRAGGAFAPGLTVEPEGDLYPIVRGVARAGEPAGAPALPSPREVFARVARYRAREEAGWARVAARIAPWLEAGVPVVIYGAGVHTAQLLARTPLGTTDLVRAVVDSDPQKHGLALGTWRVQGPELIASGGARGCAVVISSYASEAEIAAALAPHAGLVRAIVTLYDEADRGSP